MTILAEIIAAKRSEVSAIDASAVADRLAAAPPVRGFTARLRTCPAPAVIAEFKRASPSKGPIRPDAEPADIAARYERAGAAALSVLTDAKYFSGSLADLAQARGATSLPTLRKDFVIDPIQVAEARAAGADAVLLIVAALSRVQLTELMGAAADLAMDALVEVHNEAEVERALAAKATLVGVNNRDLHTFETDTQVTADLMPLLSTCTVVSESGIDDPESISQLEAIGVTGFLVGEALMRATDPGKELARLRGET